MTTLLSIIGALLVLSVLVFVHELGHFGVGRLLKFDIMEFAIGMGPALIKKEKNGVTYALRAFPIGGMCRFYGEDEDAKESNDGRVPFNAQKWWKRFLVVVAGPVMNILSAILIAIIALCAYGDFMPTIAEPPVAGTPAYEAGVREGDVIVAVDGDTVSFYNEVFTLIDGADSSAAVLTVDRGGERMDLTVRDFYNQEKGGNLMGITVTSSRMHFGFFESVGRSFAYVWELFREMLSFLGSIFTQGISSDDVAGPVGTIKIIGDAVRLGFEIVLRLSVILSINLAIMNLLPLPALDGGRLAFIAVEAVRGKPVPPNKEAIVHFVGLILLFALVIFLTYNDIAKLIGG